MYYFTASLEYIVNYLFNWFYNDKDYIEFIKKESNLSLNKLNINDILSVNPIKTYNFDNIYKEYTIYQNKLIKINYLKILNNDCTIYIVMEYLYDTESNDYILFRKYIAD